MHLPIHFRLNNAGCCLVLLAFLTPQHLSAQTTHVAVPFQAANWSFLDPAFASAQAPPLTSNQRQVVFSLPQQFTPSAVVLPQLYQPSGLGGMGWGWSGETLATVQNPSSGSAVYGYADGSAGFPSISIKIYAVPMTQGSTYEQAIASVIPGAQNLPGTTVSGPIATNLPMTISGGDFDGRRLSLSGQCMTFSSAYDPIEGEEQTDEIVFAVDWGASLAEKYFLIIDLEVNTAIDFDGTGASHFATQFANQLFGYPSVAAFNASVLQGLIGSLGIRGAAPDLLLFYDFSASHAPPWPILVPLSSPVLDFSIYPYVNQFDAGIKFNLPVDYDLKGGAACGPTSLAMALCDMGLPYPVGPDLGTIYANTVTNVTTGFEWAMARAWLGGADHYEDVTFTYRFSSVVRPLYPRILSHTNPARFSSDWRTIDSFLLANHPVLLRTDLTSVPEPFGTYVAGGGHVILLLGQGHSDYVAAAYQSLYGADYGSGDYYIVADPAGHYFANSARTTGHDYQTMEVLRGEGNGINYGGLCAMYPKRLLQQRTCADPKCGSEAMRALLFGAANYATWQVQSPLSLTITDPSGNQTGIQANGSVGEAIPDSQYQPDVADSEDAGQTILAGGSKSVVVNNPARGIYRADLIATASGPYTFIVQYIAIDGTLATNVLKKGLVSTGDHLVFDLDLSSISAGPSRPQPRISSTSLAGANLVFNGLNGVSGGTYYVLTSTDLEMPVSQWPPIATNVLSAAGGFSITLTNTVSRTAPKRFYILQLQ